MWSGSHDPRLAQPPPLHPPQPPCPTRAGWAVRVVWIEAMTERRKQLTLTDLCFIDTETTGLDPDVHEIWEVGAIVDDEEHHWFLPVDLGRADAMALKIGHFHERWQSSELGRSFMNAATPLDVFARDFAALTRGRHLVGAVPSFDDERLRKLLRANGACPEWHYHLIDVETLAVGYLWGQVQGDVIPDPVIRKLPWDSEALSKAVGVMPPNESERHTALSDARWAKRIYEAVISA